MTSGLLARQFHPEEPRVVGSLGIRIQVFRDSLEAALAMTRIGLGVPNGVRPTGLGLPNKTYDALSLSQVIQVLAQVFPP